MQHQSLTAVENAAPAAGMTLSLMVMLKMKHHFNHLLTIAIKQNTTTTALCLKKRDPDIIDCNFKKD